MREHSQAIWVVLRTVRMTLHDLYQYSFGFTSTLTASASTLKASLIMIMAPTSNLTSSKSPHSISTITITASSSTLLALQLPLGFPALIKAFTDTFMALRPLQAFLWLLQTFSRPLLELLWLKMLSHHLYSSNTVSNEHSKNHHKYAHSLYKHAHDLYRHYHDLKKNSHGFWNTIKSSLYPMFSYSWDSVQCTSGASSYSAASPWLLYDTYLLF